MSTGHHPYPKAKGGYTRDPDDFFPTPPECTYAFLREEGDNLPKQIWEPACGDGAIAKILPGEVICSDLVERGYGKGKIDFLMERIKWADAIITNPPFKLWDEFIHRALWLETPYIAMFIRTTALNTAAWSRLYDLRAPARLYSLSWRPDIFCIGSPDQRCSFIWAVWDDRVERNPKATIYKTMKRRG